jgi:hypothetical protein
MRVAGLLSTILSAILLTTGLAILVSFTPGVISAETPDQREPFTDTACLDCHTDRAQLEELTASMADEPEEDALSSGPG